MNALLLAAGMGSRLQPLSTHVPKCLVPIRGKPLLELWLEMLFAGPVERVLINTHHLSGMVEAFIAAGPWRERVTLVHEPQLLGTAGTALRNEGFTEGRPFLLAHADNLSLFSAEAFIEAHRLRPRGAELTMMLFETPSPESCGIVELDGGSIVRAFHEKVPRPPGRLANGAVYIVEPAVLAFLRGLKKSVIDFSTEVIPPFLGRIHTYLNRTYHRDIGTLDSLVRAQADFPATVSPTANRYWIDLIRREDSAAARAIAAHLGHR